MSPDREIPAINIPGVRTALEWVGAHFAGLPTPDPRGTVEELQDLVQGLAMLVTVVLPADPLQRACLLEAVGEWVAGKEAELDL